MPVISANRSVPAFGIGFHLNKKIELLPFCLVRQSHEQAMQL